MRSNRSVLHLARRSHSHDFQASGGSCRAGIENGSANELQSLLCTCEENLFEQDSEHSDPAKAGLCRLKSFVSPCQSAESSEPSEGSFDHPASWQRNEALFGLRMFDHDQLNPFFFCKGRGFLPGVTPVDESDLYARSSRIQLAPQVLRPVPVSCSFAGVTVKASRLPSVSTAAWAFDPFCILWPSLPTLAPLSGVDCSVGPSMIAAEGCGFLSSSIRTRILRSRTISSRMPANAHRRIC